MIIQQKILVIEKVNKEYNFEGRQGVSLAVRCLIDTDVFRLKTTKDVLDLVEEGKPYTATIKLSTTKEEPRFELVSVGK